jgi:acetyl-CoA/propionyl-CoA carboxylase biotin carboxyl carrier protein
VGCVYKAAAGGHLGERDCSLQRATRRWSVAAGPLGRSARAAGGGGAAPARTAGYVGAGTAEFLLADDGTFVFLELNARLQVEHPVTEAVTGLDLVAAQLRIAAGESLGLAQADVRIDGHAIEARLYAEDPGGGFLPATGRIAGVAWPTGPGVRLDAGVGPGDGVGTLRPAAGQVVAHGPDRAGAGPPGCRAGRQPRSA